MRSTSSGKRLYRSAGLAVAFVLAVTAALCAFSFSSGGIPDGNTAYAAPWVFRPTQLTDPGPGPTFLPITPVSEWKYVEKSFFHNEDTDIYIDNYHPSTYINAYYYNSNAIMGDGNKDTNDSIAKFNPTLPTDVHLALYLYYKLPQELVTSGAVIDVTATTSSGNFGGSGYNKEFFSVNLTDAPDATNIDRKEDSQEINGNEGYFGGAKGECYPRFATGTNQNASFTGGQVTATSCYIRVMAKMHAEHSLGGSPYLKIEGLTLNIHVRSVKDIAPFVPENPVFYRWDGAADELRTFYNGATPKNVNALRNPAYDVPEGKNVIGGYSDWFKPGNTGNQIYYEGDSNLYDPEEGSDIRLVSLRTDGTMQKTFSCLLYDHYTGLRTAKLFGGGKTFDLMDFTGAGHVFNRTNSAKTLPAGISEITVRPFGFETAELESSLSGEYRGLSVKVVFDGLKSEYNPETGQYVQVPDEREIPYYFDYTGNTGRSGYRVGVYMGGLDFTPPAVPDTLKYVTPSDVTVDGSGEETIWFSEKNVEFKILAEADNRDSEDGEWRDVTYSYELRFNSNKPADDNDYPETTQKKKDIPVKNVVYGKKGSPLKLKNLESGYYLLTLYGEDRFYRYVANPGSEDNSRHQVFREFRFNVDANIQNFQWPLSVTVGEDEIGYDGDWANEPVDIMFRDIFEYTHFPEGVSMEYFFRGKRENLSKPPVKLELKRDKDGALMPFTVDNDRISQKAGKSERWYCEEGFDRSYVFRLTLASGKVIEFVQTVRFDDYAEETPYSSLLYNYNQSNPYADLLDLRADIGFTVGNERDPHSIRNYDRGSPMTLYCEIGDNEPEAYSVSEITDRDEILLKPFWDEAAWDVQNVSGPERRPISFWFEDAAGNEGEKITYPDFWLDTARLYLHFTANDVKRYYNGRTNTPADLLEYRIFKDRALTQKVDRMDVSVEEKGPDAYQTVYARPSAGPEDVMVSGVSVVSRDGSPYCDLVDIYVLACVNDSDPENRLVFDLPDDPEIPFAATRHEIKPARIAVGWYRNEAGNIVPYDKFEREYSGRTEFAVENLGGEALACVDKEGFIVGSGYDEASKPWKNITWSGTLKISDAAVVYDSSKEVGFKTAEIREPKLMLRDGLWVCPHCGCVHDEAVHGPFDELPEDWYCENCGEAAKADFEKESVSNYVAANGDGGMSTSTAVKIVPKCVVVRGYRHSGENPEGLEELCKIYDQKGDIPVTSRNFVIEGIGMIPVSPSADTTGKQIYVLEYVYLPDDGSFPEDTVFYVENEDGSYKPADGSELDDAQLYVRVENYVPAPDPLPEGTETFVRDGRLSLQLSTLKPEGLFFEPAAGEEQSVKDMAAKYGVLPDGKYYSVTITAILNGFEGANARNYRLVDNFTDKKPLPDNKFTFTEVTVKPREIGATFGRLFKTFDGRTDGGTFEGPGTGKNQYRLEDVYAGDEVSLDLENSWWETPEAGWGTYTFLDGKQATAHCVLAGKDAACYFLPDRKTDAEIGRSRIDTIELGGIFVYDRDGRYWYTAKDEDGHDVLYRDRKDGEENYIRYDRWGNVSEVPELPEGAEPKVIQGWFSGGVVVLNDRRIELSDNPVYDFVYKEGETVKEIDPLDEKNRARVDRRDLRTGTKVSESKTVTVTPQGFPENASMTMDEHPNYVPCDFSVTAFPDFALDGLVHTEWPDEGGYSYAVEYDVSGDARAQYDSKERWLRVEDRNGYEQTWLGAVRDGTSGKAVPVVDAGTYDCRIRIRRKNDGKVMIVEKRLIIDKASVLLVLSDEESARVVSYRNHTAAAVLSKITENGYRHAGVDDPTAFKYRYSDSKLGPWTDKAPEGGGTFWVKGSYAGGDNVLPAESEPKRFVIKGAAVSYPESDPVYVWGRDEVVPVSVEDLLGADYRKYADDFMIVYNNPAEGEEDEEPEYTTTLPSDPGIHYYTVVHKGRVDKNGKMGPGSLHLSAAVDPAGKTGRIIIGLSELASVSTAADPSGVPNDLGVIRAVDGILPPVRSDRGELIFRLEEVARVGTDKKKGEVLLGSAGEMDNINNGLYEQRSKLKNHYEAKGVYRASLVTVEYEKDTVTSRVIPPETGSVSVTMKEPGKDMKLFRFLYNPDGTYEVKEMKYDSNGDGTVTFSTDRLGDFVFAVPFTGKTSGTIGAEGVVAGVAGGIGGLTAIFILIGAIVKAKKRNIVG